MNFCASNTASLGTITVGRDVIAIRYETVWLVSQTNVQGQRCMLKLKTLKSFKFLVLHWGLTGIGYNSTQKEPTSFKTSRHE